MAIYETEKKVLVIANSHCLIVFGHPVIGW
jgi:hypothetical protein